MRESTLQAHSGIEGGTSIKRSRSACKIWLIYTYRLGLGGGIIKTNEAHSCPSEKTCFGGLSSGKRLSG